MSRDARAAHGGAEVSRVLASLGGDIDSALERIGVAAFVLDPQGRIRYQNERARAQLGDWRGRHFSEVVASRSQMEARVRFTRQVFGTEPVSSAEAWLRTRDGDVPVEVHAVAMDSGERVVGVFGLFNPKREGRSASAPRGSTLLTPRQLQVLQYLGEGRSTTEIAEEMNLARETVRNHIRAVLRGLGVHSRLEAVVEAQRLGLLND
jgi:PAS domain S-box-containing protein